MTTPILLASGSEIRATLLRNAGVAFEVMEARIDEDAIKSALLAESANPRDVADTLAELKARKISARMPDALVIGCDQILEVGGAILSKPKNPTEALAQLKSLQGKTHRLLSAVVIYQKNEPLWRHVGTVRLTMHENSETWLSAYVDRNWPSIQSAVGSYKLEEEGVRLFSRIEGDYFTVLGLPLLELLSYLNQRGVLPT